MEKVTELKSAPLEAPEIQTSRRPWWIWLAAAIIGLSIGYFGAMLAKERQDERSAGIVEYAPAFELESLSTDGMLRLSDYQGKAIVLNFWASWCFPCKIEMPALQQAWENNQDSNIVFIGVNIWDEEQNAIDFLDEFGVTFPKGVDTSEEIIENYNILGVPTTWFIYPDGSVARKIMGPLDLESLDEMIDLILGN